MFDFLNWHITNPSVIRESWSRSLIIIYLCNLTVNAQRTLTVSLLHSRAFRKNILAKTYTDNYDMQYAQEQISADLAHSQILQTTTWYFKTTGVKGCACSSACSFEYDYATHFLQCHCRGIVYVRALPSSLKDNGNQDYLQFCFGCYAIVVWISIFIIFKWVLANSDEYHLLKWVLATPLSQSSMCKIQNSHVVKWVWSIHLNLSTGRTKL